MHRHELYPLWRAIVQRCEQETHPDYPRYGGRGIRLCEQWHDVRVFVADLEAEIGPRPPDRLPNGHAAFSLDRRDNDGNYEPGNVRWATRLEQVLNRGSAPWENRWARLRQAFLSSGMEEAVAIMDSTPLAP